MFFFFFKQKTAYEMRISDWSSDVCSSDLRVDHPRDMARAREQESLRSRQMIHQPPDAGERRDMILAARLDISGGLDLLEVDRRPQHRQAVRDDHAIVVIEVDQILDRKSTRLNSSH